MKKALQYEIQDFVKSLEILDLKPDQCLFVKMKGIPSRDFVEMMRDVIFSSNLKCKVVFYDERIESITVVRTSEIIPENEPSNEKQKTDLVN